MYRVQNRLERMDIETGRAFRQGELRRQVIRDGTEMRATERRGEGRGQYEWRADRSSRHPVLVSRGTVVSNVSENIAILRMREVGRRHRLG